MWCIVNLCWGSCIVLVMLLEKSLKRTANVCDASVRTVHNIHQEKKSWNPQQIASVCFKLLKSIEKELVPELDDVDKYIVRQTVSGFYKN